jgi:hypothetical protein
MISVFKRFIATNPSESLMFDVPRVTLSTLKLALSYDLATEKDGNLTGKPEKSERA